MSAYEVITARIIEQLEQGVAPWRKPWASKYCFPRSLNTLREYRGINVILLSSAGYESPWWLSYRQAQELGGHVRKGEKAMPVVFYKQWERENADTGEVDKIPLLRYSSVFNASQIDGIDHLVPPSDVIPAPHEPIAECERIVANMPQRPAIECCHSRAFYRPSSDMVGMPSIGRFESPEAYHATLFHELGHSTGHATRLSRPGIVDEVRFGSETYGNEELVAEMTAAFLCGRSGIQTATIDNASAYIGGWLRAIRKDSRLVVTAASAAQRAADFILGVA